MVVLFLLATLCANGCGGAHGNVSGKVTSRGQPVVIGSVVMIGSDTIPLTGAIDANGNYAIPDVPAGLVQVGVVSPDPGIPAKRASVMAIIAKANAKGKASGKGDIADMASPGVAADAARAKKKWVRLPKDVEFPDRSGITTTIQSGENTFHIELK
jgi:hypothetical protein